MWFTLLGFLRPAIKIFLIPLYLIKISPADYGVLALILVFSTLFGVVVSLRLSLSVNTFYFDYNQDESLLKKYVGQIFSVAVLVCLVAFVFISFLGEYAFDFIFNNESIVFYPLGILAVAQVFLSSCNSIYFTYLKNGFRVKEYVFFNATIIVFQILIQAILILVYDYGILGILIGGLVPVAIVFLYLILTKRFLINFNLESKYIKPSLLFSFGFLPVTFLVLFEKQIDRVILERYLDLEQVGLYALLIGMMSLFNILTRAYDNAIKPVLYQALKDEDENTSNTLNAMYGTYIVVGVFGLSSILLVGSHLHLITDNLKYLSITNYFPYAVLAGIPMILVKYEILVILFYKKTFLLSILTLFKTLVMIVLMILLIPKYGIYGAIGSLLISNILNFISFRVLNSKLSKVRFRYTKILYTIMPFLILLLLHIYLGGIIGHSWSSFIVFVFTLISFGVIEKATLKQIFSSLQSKLR